MENLESQRYREEKHWVTVTHDPYGVYEDEVSLRVSHNGYQSVVINLSRQEAQMVIDALTNHYKFTGKDESDAL